MARRNFPFPIHWNVDQYKVNYDPEYWDLCRSFMVTHKTKYPEQRLVNLTEAFYQIGVYGSSYDPKTTRIVSALAIEVLDEFLKRHPGTLTHPFDKSAVVIPEVVDITDTGDASAQAASQSASIWDAAVDMSIIVNVLVQPQLSALLKGFVIIYDVRKASTLNDNKANILEESFKRSKFGPIHWEKTDTHNNICPIRMCIKWKGTVLAEASGTDEKSLRMRLAQALLSKIALFSPGIEAKWSYYRNGKMPDLFDRPNPRRSNVYKIMPRSQLRGGMPEIISYIDMFANSDSFAETIFGLDFSSQEKKQMMEYINKTWNTKLTYRTVTKMGAKNKTETHICIYHIRRGDELRSWLERCEGENERYRVIPAGYHRRAGTCDKNVREILTSAETVDLTEEEEQAKETLATDEKSKSDKESEVKKVQDAKKQKEDAQKKNEEDAKKQKEEAQKKKEEDAKKLKEDGKGKESVKGENEPAGDLEKELDGFVLFYDANRYSKIDKDDWFSALCDSFKKSKFGPLEVVVENVRALRTRCVFKWKGRTLASAEGLTETQAKTAATLQLLSLLEPFTFIIQAKEDYFFGGKVPPFIENPDPNKTDVRVVRRNDLPSYYSIFQTIDEFVKKPSYSEIVFGEDFTWELKNEIRVYLEAKNLDYRYFTTGDKEPCTHMAVYHIITPESLKNHLEENGGENEKYKLILPQKAEPSSEKTSEAEAPKVSEKSTTKDKPLPAKVAEKRKQPEKEPAPVEDLEVNKIQIKLKRFKKDKVEYPEDTGGDFPGLILWLGIKKNSVWQRNLFCILVESFKMSKYGELVIEEYDENVWGRKEPLKKCVIKSNRKVLAVGMGESKTEARHTASLQVLKQLRKHCYTIQAKESYFKEGKATPYDFNPDPAKDHVYRLAKRSNFKDRAAIFKFVDDFAKKQSTEEIIFGDDFTYNGREEILEHCRKINLPYRLIKCQSTGKIMHTHIAIYHHTPLPVLKATLIKLGGENDMYRLIPPGGKITCQSSEDDIWPDSLEDGKPVTPKIESNPVAQPSTIQTITNGQLSIAPSIQSAAALPNTGIVPGGLSGGVLSVNINNKEVDNFIPTLVLVNKDVTQKVTVMGLNSNITSKELSEPLHNIALGPQPIYPGGPPFIQNTFIPEVPFGPQPLHALHQNMPLTFGPQGQPMVYMPMQPGPVVYGDASMAVPPDQQTGSGSVAVPPDQVNTVDLREELSKKRQADSVNKETPGRKVVKDSDESWSRKVFVADEKSTDPKGKLPEGQATEPKSKEKSNNLPKDKVRRIESEERIIHRQSPGNIRRRISPGRGRRRTIPDRHRISPGRDRRMISPERFLPDRFGGHEERIVRRRDHSFERRSPPELSRERRYRRSMSRSPRRSPIPFRGERRFHKSSSPVMRFRDLWDNIAERFSQSIFMYKYVKQDSTTERDPFALLRATRSLSFNVDFDFIKHQIAIDEWQVSVELVTDDSSAHPLVGEGIGATEQEARLIAAYHAVDTIQKACRVIEPNFGYFAEGGVPDFIARRSPMKTAVYEIIQNLDPSQPIDRYTADVMFRMFLSSDMEDMFFLASDFSYLERVLVIEVAKQSNVWWRLFGPRHPDAHADDIVSTQHICVFKQKSALQLVRELLANGGSTEKYTLVDPRENRITQPGHWPMHPIMR